MFVSRTVAAEVCMEARQNESAYSALKILDRREELRFELSYVQMIFTSLWSRYELTQNSSVIDDLIKVVS